MRHEDISTTMTFYVGRNAETAADAIWNASETISATASMQPPANSLANPCEIPRKQADQSLT